MRIRLESRAKNLWAAWLEYKNGERLPDGASMARHLIDGDILDAVKLAREIWPGVSIDAVIAASHLEPES